MMIRLCLVASLLFASTASFSVKTMSCKTQFITTLSSFKSALTLPNTDATIDRLADTALLIPGVLEACLGSQAAASYQKEVSNQCVLDLDKAAKLGVKILNETDSELKTARDLALFQRQMQTKVKKDCAFLHDLSLEDIRQGGVCMESSYKLSLVVQKLGEDLKKGDNAGALKDVDIIVTNLPDTLEACGQAAMAAKVRKLLPMPCVHAIEGLVAELGVAEHNYDHLEWLVKHYKEILQSFGTVKTACPLLE